VRELSRQLWARRERAPHPEHWESAYYRLLRAQSSCNFFLGEAWVGKAHADLNEAEQRLAEM